MNFQYQHAFLGLGNMAEAILASLLKTTQINPKQVIISRRSPTALKKQTRRWQVQGTQKNLEAVLQSRFIWLGVKPQQAANLLSEFGSNLSASQVVISMMAGVSIKTLRHWISAPCPIIRIMPNTPAMIGCGAIGVYFPKNLKANIKNELNTILKGMGKIEILTQEKLLDAVTGLSGSGPAFVYQIAQAMIKGGQRSGLSLKQAKSLCLQTLKGATLMMQTSQKDLEQLTNAVVSKGGTTEAGLKVLKAKMALETISEAVIQASLRAKALRLESESCIS